MKIIVFDTETTGLPEDIKASTEKTELWPYIVQFSWLIYDDVTKKVSNINNHIIKLPDNIEIPEDSVRIHGITNERMKSEGKPILHILKNFTKDFLSCQILVGHNLHFDSKVIQAEYNRNNLINRLEHHRKIEYCTMRYGKEITKIWTPSKFYDGMYLKPPKLVELYTKLFNKAPKNLHNSLVDVFVCFRCYHMMVFEYDICSALLHPEVSKLYNSICSL